MIHNIRDSFNEILLESDWMDDATKVVAKEKVSTIYCYVQYDKRYGNVNSFLNYIKHI